MTYPADTAAARAMALSQITTALAKLPPEAQRAVLMDAVTAINAAQHVAAHWRPV